MVHHLLSAAQKVDYIPPKNTKIGVKRNTEYEKLAAKEAKTHLKLADIKKNIE